MALLTSGDRVYASIPPSSLPSDPYTILGDFGFNQRRFGLQDFAHKWMFSRDTFTTGKKKNRFNSFQEITVEEQNWIKNYLNEMEFELKKTVTANR